MDSMLRQKERKLEGLRIDNEIAEERAGIAEKKAIERDMKKKYGPDWKKILGIVRGIKPNREAIQDLYTLNPELRDLNKPGGGKRLR